MNTPITPPAPPITRTTIALCVAIIAAATAIGLWIGAGRTDAAAPTGYCDDSSCTSTVPDTTTTVAPSTSSSTTTTTAAPTTTSTTAPPTSTTSTTSSTPPTSTTAAPTTVVVGPPPTTSPAPCDNHDGYAYVRYPDGTCGVDICVVRTGPDSVDEYTWYYTTPPTDVLYVVGSTTHFVVTCYVPRPSTLPVTGADHQTLILAALIVGVAGSILLAVSRRRSAA